MERWQTLGPLPWGKTYYYACAYGEGMKYLHRRRLRSRSRRRDVKVRWVHRGLWDLGRMDRHYNGLVERGSLWVLPAVEGAIKESGRTLTLYGGVAVLKLKLRRGLCDGTGGKD
eukprot:scaffold2529_cov122-Isochrysis_galbana.AAC.18